ncbi:MAG: c-type cytochrome biogenesis protein CcmI [Granulosicoccus sp.]
MTLFFLLATLLVLISLAWLLYGLLNADKQNTDQEAVNITLARERRETLDAALADGSIDQATFDYEREQLEYDLAADLLLDKASPVVRQGHIPAAILVAVFVPVTAGALYLQLGNPRALTMDTTPQSVEQPSQSAPDMADLLPQLEERLAGSPNDVNGWRLLGRSYMSIGELPKARDALQKAVELDGSDAPTLALLAESIGMIQEGSLEGEPIEYLLRAQEIDPDNEHSLWLLSIAYQQSGDHQTALVGFDRLREMAQQNPEALSVIESMRANSTQALGLSSDETDAAAQSTSIDSAALSVAVSVSEEVMAAVDPSHTVFVYARATEGPPMPLAVSRLLVSDLPTTVTLDETMAMIPGMSITSFPLLTVGARVSASGNAIAQSGDWYTEDSNLSLGDGLAVDLVIQQQVP